MPDGGDQEAYLTADYNAEMVEHIDAHPTLRDRATSSAILRTSSMSGSVHSFR